MNDHLKNPIKSNNPANKPDSNSKPRSTTTTITGPNRHSSTRVLNNNTKIYASQQPK